MIQNASPKTKYTITVEWLIEYIPKAAYKWMLQTGRPSVPYDALAFVQDLISTNKKFVVDTRKMMDARSHKLANLGRVNRHLLSHSGAPASMSATQTQ